MDGWPPYSADYPWYIRDEIEVVKSKNPRTLFMLRTDIEDEPYEQALRFIQLKRRIKSKKILGGGTMYVEDGHVEAMFYNGSKAIYTKGSPSIEVYPPKTPYGSAGEAISIRYAIGNPKYIHSHYSRWLTPRFWSTVRAAPRWEKCRRCHGYEWQGDEVELAMYQLTEHQDHAYKCWSCRGTGKRDYGLHVYQRTIERERGDDDRGPKMPRVWSKAPDQFYYPEIVQDAGTRWVWQGARDGVMNRTLRSGPWDQTAGVFRMLSNGDPAKVDEWNEPSESPIWSEAALYAPEANWHIPPNPFEDTEAPKWR